LCRGAARVSAVLGDVPLLLPTTHSAVRARLDQWFEHAALKPRISGEFEDSALLATFGASPGVSAATAAFLAASCIAALGYDAAKLLRNPSPAR
jgi:hypothetical protein